MYPGRKSLEVSNVFVPQDWRFPSVIKFFLGFYIKIDMCRVLCLARLPINFNKWSLVKGAFLSNSMFFFTSYLKFQIGICFCFLLRGTFFITLKFFLCSNLIKCWTSVTACALSQRVAAVFAAGLEINATMCI